MSIKTRYVNSLDELYRINSDLLPDDMDKIKSLVGSFSGYVSNLENKIRAFGENELADRVIKRGICNV